MATIAVMGAGSWGTAFALVLADAGNQVRIWGRRTELCEAITTTHENPDYLPGIALPESITASSDAEQVLDGAEVVVLAVPSQQLRTNLDAWGKHVPDDAVFISLMKGVELGTHLRMSEVIAEITGAGPERIAVVSGPNLAKEIAAREPAASVVACADEATAVRLQTICHSPTFRPYTNNDVVGCELGGVLKNVIAIAVGMGDGQGAGDKPSAAVEESDATAVIGQPLDVQALLLARRHGDRLAAARRLKSQARVTLRHGQYNSSSITQKRNGRGRHDNCFRHRQGVDHRCRWTGSDRRGRR